MVIELDAAVAANVLDLERELLWFAQLLDLRLKLYFVQPDSVPECRSLSDLPPPSLHASRSDWAALVNTHARGFVERTALVLALVPHLRPQLLDVFFIKNATFDRRFSEFGGSRADDEFEPTGETLAFVLGGGSLESRAAAARIVAADHPLVLGGVLRPAIAHADQPALKAPLRISSEVLNLLAMGRNNRPALGTEFPAQRIETELQWEDLILHPGTLQQLEEIHAFVMHGKTLMQDWGMASRLRPGHRSLFHGPPGTGKTMSVALIGKVAHRDVYRIDLSLVMSKYIGETEKSLARVFERAEQQDWILFFDEADALFGKRTETRDAHDRYANQEVAYLLQRVETFSGIAILASNLRENLDDAFMRRFESVVYFPLPGADDRVRLWQRGFSPKARLSEDVDLVELARGYELSGGSIMNVIRYVSLAAIRDGERAITRSDLAQGIRRELAKEGRR